MSRFLCEVLGKGRHCKMLEQFTMLIYPLVLKVRHLGGSAF